MNTLSRLTLDHRLWGEGAPEPIPLAPIWLLVRRSRHRPTRWPSVASEANSARHTAFETYLGQTVGYTPALRALDAAPPNGPPNLRVVERLRRGIFCVYKDIAKFDAFSRGRADGGPRRLRDALSLSPMPPELPTNGVADNCLFIVAKTEHLTLSEIGPPLMIERHIRPIDQMVSDKNMRDTGTDISNERAAYAPYAASRSLIRRGPTG